MLEGLIAAPRTLTELKQAAGDRGMVVRKTDGEYRVNYKGGEEATAYYTNDMGDAYRTMLAMVFDRDGMIAVVLS